MFEQIFMDTEIFHQSKSTHTDIGFFLIFYFMFCAWTFSIQSARIRRKTIEAFKNRALA